MSAMPQPHMPKVWRVETKPHKFCPGCGHPLVLKVLGECIEELNIEDRMVSAAISAVHFWPGTF